MLYIFMHKSFLFGSKYIYFYLQTDSIVRFAVRCLEHIRTATHDAVRAVAEEGLSHCRSVLQDLGETSSLEHLLHTSRARPRPARFADDVPARQPAHEVYFTLCYICRYFCLH